MSECTNEKNKWPGEHNGSTCTYCGEGTEVERLRKAVRYLYLTLGYYATDYNYDPKNICYHPLTGQPASGIMFDGPDQAKEAIEKVKMFLPELKEII